MPLTIYIYIFTNKHTIIIIYKLKVQKIEIVN